VNYSTDNYPESRGRLVGSANQIAHMLTTYLPLQSPAPLHNIHHWHFHHSWRTQLVQRTCLFNEES